MNTTTLPALPVYFMDHDGLVHKLTTRTDHYGRWADPRQQVGYMYESACGLGTDEYALILSSSEVSDSAEAASDGDPDAYCDECFRCAHCEPVR